MKNKVALKELKNKLDVSNTSTIDTFGQILQDKVSAVSNKMLANITNKEQEEISKNLVALMNELNQADPKKLVKQSFFDRLFGRVKAKFDATVIQFQTINETVDTIHNKLLADKDSLKDSNLILEEVYQANEEAYIEISKYIQAGEEKLAELKQQVQQMNSTDNFLQTQKRDDLVYFMNKLDKRLYDLKATQTILQQSAPQIRIFQRGNDILSDKIQTSLSTAIPIWKQQILLAIELKKQEASIERMKAVENTTNNIILANSELFSQNVTSIAQANELPVIKIETLQKTNDSLIKTVEELKRIAEKGLQDRKQALSKLTKIGSLTSKKLIGNAHE